VRTDVIISDEYVPHENSIMAMAAQSRDLIQVGVNVVCSREKNSSESVRAAGPAGPGQPTGPYILYTNVAT
jgi:hypothetical protein